MTVYHFVGTSAPDSSVHRSTTARPAARSFSRVWQPSDIDRILQFPDYPDPRSYDSRSEIPAKKITAILKNQPAPDENWEFRYLYTEVFSLAYHGIFWDNKIRDSEDVREIIGLLRLVGFGTIADRLIYLNEKFDAHAGEQPPDIISVKNMALFLRLSREFGEPAMGLATNGLVTAEWSFQSGERLAIRFLSSVEEIMFAAIGHARYHGVRPRLSGRGSHGDVLKILDAFGIREWWRSRATHER